MDPKITRLTKNQVETHLSLVEDPEWRENCYSTSNATWFGVMVDGIAVSALSFQLDSHGGHFWLSDAYTLVPHRKCGHMAALLEHCKGISVASGIPLRLSALETSKKLCEESGFGVVRVLTQMTFKP